MSRKLDKKLVKKSLIKKLRIIKEKEAWLDVVSLPILIFSKEEWDLFHTKEGLKILKKILREGK